MRASPLSLSESNTPRAILDAMEREGLDELPVVAADGTLRGTVERRAVERRLYDRGDEEAPAAAIAEETVVHATRDEPIEDAVDAMLEAEVEVLPVLSSDRQLEGLLVLDDLRDDHELIEGVEGARQRRAVAAGAGVARMTLACSLVSAALGFALFALWLDGPGYGLPTWVAWGDGLAALLAFIGAVAAAAHEMFSVPLWAVAGVGLCFTAAAAHAWHHGPGATWLQLALAIPFLLLVVVIGAALPARRHARRMSLAGQAR
ncbi:MAG TPA: CBS domain-containing protein [Polyangia bacterium]|nr:CBS domain-containing protein [Polyangia bacterium]